MDSHKIPVLVGCGQVVQKEKDPLKARPPLEMMVEASKRAAADCGLGDKLWDSCDTVACVRLIIDSPGVSRVPFGKYSNLSGSVAAALGAKSRQHFYGPTGGNTPQMLVNFLCEEIARGRSTTALLCGGECFATYRRALGQGLNLDWPDGNPQGERVDIGVEKAGTSAQETAHGLHFPVNAYPLFENALRGHKNRDISQHQKELGALFSSFSRVAQDHAQAWFPTFRTPEEIATPSAANRYVGFPYTKYMNAVMEVDQAAALVLMSQHQARTLGIPEEKYIYLHGCADTHDIWHISERVNLHSSPAIATMGRKAFAMADWSCQEIDHMDIYSCFPSAVQISCQELGIPLDGTRPLTVTGGLPYFGGAGNNYVLHSIATMMDTLRANPGDKGLCTANGYYVTKHSMGLYSTTAPGQPWQREDPASYQAELDTMEHPHEVTNPSGKARVESYTVAHDRHGPKTGIILGRLGDGGGRFVAHTSSDSSLLQRLVDEDQLGRHGTVAPQKDGRNLFTFV